MLFRSDGGQFPAKALVTGRRAGRRYAFTLGVSALCQPAVEQFWQDEASQHRRIELGFAAGEDLPEEAWMGMLNWLSAQSGLPWRYLTWLGHGHTIPCNRLPGFEAVLFVDPRELAGVEGPELPPVMGEPVSLLWAVPLTLEALERRGLAPDRATVALRGSRVDHALARTAAQLCPLVRRLVVDAPRGGEDLALWLHREFGVPVLPPAERGAVALRFQEDCPDRKSVV